MRNEAFKRGFIKAAMLSGLNPLAAEAFYKSAEQNPVADNIYNSMLAGGGLGALGGGLVGGTAGFLSGRDEDPNKDHSVRNAIGGGLLGAGIGGVGGGYLGGDSAWRAVKDPLVSGMQNQHDQGVKQLAEAESSWSHRLGMHMPIVGDGLKSLHDVSQKNLATSQDSINQLKNMPFWNVLRAKAGQ